MLKAASCAAARSYAHSMAASSMRRRTIYSLPQLHHFGLRTFALERQPALDSVHSRTCTTLRMHVPVPFSMLLCPSIASSTCETVTVEAILQALDCVRITANVFVVFTKTALAGKAATRS